MTTVNVTKDRKSRILVFVIYDNRKCVQSVLCSNNRHDVGLGTLFCIHLTQRIIWKQQQWFMQGYRLPMTGRILQGKSGTWKYWRKRNP